MQRTKLLTLAACMLSAAATFAQAPPAGQAPPPGGGPGGRRQMRAGRVEDRLQRMSERLNLTDEQKEKIRPMLQDEFKQLKALRQDTSLSQEQRRDKAREIRKSTHQQIAQILTPEQKEKMRQRRREARDKGAGETGQPPEKQ